MAKGNGKRTNKRPRQQRSTETVNAILEAATYILTREGWPGFTTNKVADKAGVNIASLYQYFPDKVSIVAELQRRHFEKIRKDLPQIKEAVKVQPTLRDKLKLIVENGIREHQTDTTLHRIFIEELPRSIRRSDPIENLEVTDWNKSMVRDWKEIALPHMKRVPKPELAGFIARTASHALIHETAVERPELLSDPLFADEVVTLLERYLNRT